MAALPLPSPPTRRNLLVITPTPRRLVVMPRPTLLTTTPTFGRQLKVVRLPHPLSDFWPNGVMMTASQKLVIQIQLSTRNLRECQRSAPPQPALPQRLPPARPPRRCHLPPRVRGLKPQLPGCRLGRPLSVGPKAVRPRRAHS